jgi:ADP-L-glycero-D-manno-heptose 6-epimerase
MIIVTGGAGFIGSNLIYGLNQKGYNNILVVDDLGEGMKFKNLIPLRIQDYCHKDRFLDDLVAGKFNHVKIEAVFHQGACSDTMESDANYVMDTNYEYSKTLLDYCVKRNIPFLYASSASVYGNGEQGFIESRECEQPLNAYAFSKWLFDVYVQKRSKDFSSQVVGLRYFNVFGPQENHKARMASVMYHFYHQLMNQNTVNLFEGTDGYADGEQKRDFIYVKDVVKVNLFFFENPHLSGIFNCGTGKSHTFNQAANQLIQTHERGEIRYVKFPESLKGKYQNFTEANLTSLISIGYDRGFTTFEDAVVDYYKHLDQYGGYLPKEV